MTGQVAARPRTASLRHVAHMQAHTRPLAVGLNVIKSLNWLGFGKRLLHAAAQPAAGTAPRLGRSHRSCHINAGAPTYFAYG